MDNTHRIDSLCPICASVISIGIVDMTGHDKYYCPLCGGRHYGKPEKDSMGSYICMKCGEATPTGGWKRKRLKEKEVIKGPIKACVDCQKKLGEDYVALIETKDGDDGEQERTGKVYFVIPPKEFSDQLDGARSVFMNEVVIARLKEKK